MKTINITIEHSLTPFHEETLMGTVNCFVNSLRVFWEDKSKKHFKITI